MVSFSIFLLFCFGFGNYLMVKLNERHILISFIFPPLEICFLWIFSCFLPVFVSYCSICRPLFDFFELIFLILTLSQQNALYVPCHEASVQTSFECYRSVERLFVLAPLMPLTKFSLSYWISGGQRRIRDGTSDSKVHISRTVLKICFGREIFFLLIFSII